MQECAQYLAGSALPEGLLEGVLERSGVKAGSRVLVCNLTPYDCHLERAVLHWSETHASSKITMKSLSVTTNISTSEYCERSMAMELLQDGSNTFHIMVESLSNFII